MVTTVEHLAKRIGADERTLRRAVRQGTVRGRRRSPRRLEVSDAEERYLAEHWPTLQRLRGALRTEPNVKMAVVFGSVARGEERSDSDIDLLIALESEDWARRAKLNLRLERAVGQPVELVLLSRVRRENPALLVNAIRDGRVLVDRSEVWAGLARSAHELVRAAREQEQRDRRAAKAELAELLSL